MKIFYIIALLFVVLPARLQAQDVIKLRAQAFSICPKVSSTEWGEWEETVDVNFLITIDTKKMQIKTYRPNYTHIVDIVSIESKENSESYIFTFKCVGDEGDEMTVQLVKYFDPVDTGKMTFITSALAWVYLVYWA